VTYFDQLREDEGYAGGIETDRADMASSHQVKRFFKAFAWTRVFLFRDCCKPFFSGACGSSGPRLSSWVSIRW
jgi:hypothetical protein